MELLGIKCVRFAPVLIVYCISIALATNNVERPSSVATAGHVQPATDSLTRRIEEAMKTPLQNHSAGTKRRFKRGVSTMEKIKVKRLKKLKDKLRKERAKLGSGKKKGYRGSSSSSSSGTSKYPKKRPSTSSSSSSSGSAGGASFLSDFFPIKPLLNARFSSSSSSSSSEREQELPTSPVFDDRENYDRVSSSNRRPSSTRVRRSSSKQPYKTEIRKIRYYQDGDQDERESEFSRETSAPSEDRTGPDSSEEDPFTSQARFETRRPRKKTRHVIYQGRRPSRGRNRKYGKQLAVLEEIQDEVGRDNDYDDYESLEEPRLEYKRWKLIQPPLTREPSYAESSPEERPRKISRKQRKGGTPKVYVHEQHFHAGDGSSSSSEEHEADRTPSYIKYISKRRPKKVYKKKYRRPTAYVVVKPDSSDGRSTSVESEEDGDESTQYVRYSRERPKKSNKKRKKYRRPTVHVSSYREQAGSSEYDEDEPTTRPESSEESTVIYKKLKKYTRPSKYASKQRGYKGKTSSKYGQRRSKGSQSYVDSSSEQKAERYKRKKKYRRKA